MTNTKFLLQNGYARTIVALTAVHILLNVFFLPTWWSMVVFLIVSITPAMNPDLFLTVVWAAEVGTAAAASFGILKGRGTITAFVLWSAFVVIICGVRIFHGKATRGTKT